MDYKGTAKDEEESGVYLSELIINVSSHLI